MRAHAGSVQMTKPSRSMYRTSLQGVDLSVRLFIALTTARVVSTKEALAPLMSN